MLPNFLIIGVQKGATTWLANSLARHPDIFIPPQKELHFFHGHFDRGLSWYQAQFDDWTGQAAVGEATPGYIYYPEVPSRIRQTLGPDIKLIVSLRHPVDRAYSAFWMFLSRGIIPLEADFSTCFYGDRHGLRQRGYYAVQLRRYLDHFPRQNFLILIYEELKQDNRQTLERCFEFLGVDRQFVDLAMQNRRNNKAIEVSRFHYPVWKIRRMLRKSLPYNLDRLLADLGRRIFNRLPKQKAYRPLDPSLRQELLQEYRADIEQLEEILGREMSIWYHPLYQETGNGS